jgi:hypothetical protein
MFNLVKLWNNNGFEIILGLCLALILIYGLYRTITRQKGNWSNTYSTYTARDIDNLFRKNSIQKQNGIPKESKGEIECKRVLEKIFNKPFNKSRPSFLNNEITGGNYNLKEYMCKENNIILIRVPYTIKVENIEEYLRKELSRYF